MSDDLKKFIRDVPDFPKKGILFRDITPALLNPEAFRKICEILHERLKDREIDKIAAIESRGFVFASVLSYLEGKGLILLRKPGKLPWKTLTEKYELEYGEAALEIHEDAVSEGERVVIIDDLLATGGTAGAAARLIEKAGGVVEEVDFVIELTELKGRERIKDYNIFTILKY